VHRTSTKGGTRRGWTTFAARESPQTLNSELLTLNLQLQILNPKPKTQNPKPHTPNLEIQTLNPEFLTLRPERCTVSPKAQGRLAVSERIEDHDERKALELAILRDSRGVGVFL